LLCLDAFSLTPFSPTQNHGHGDDELWIERCGGQAVEDVRGCDWATEYVPEQRGDVSVVPGLMRSGRQAHGSIEAIRKSGGRLGEVGIPEMIDYLRRIGYKVCDGRFAVVKQSDR
jgi:hypothetical protein